MTLRHSITFVVLVSLALAVMLHGDPIKWTHEGNARSTTNPTNIWVIGAVILAFLIRWIHIRIRFDHTAVTLRNSLVVGVGVMVVVADQALWYRRGVYETTMMWSWAAWMLFTTALVWRIAARRSSSSKPEQPVEA